MKYHCTINTDVDELVGFSDAEGFHYGPLPAAMRQGECLELEASEFLSGMTRAKIESLTHGVFIVETGEDICCPINFEIILH